MKTSLVDNLRKTILDLLLPPRCVQCGSGGGLVCSQCEAELLSTSPLTICGICSRPAINGFTHPRCRGKRGRPSLDRTLCTFSYRGPAGALVKELKYRGVHSLVEVMVSLVEEGLEEMGVETGSQAVVVPVPLHPFRKLKRGFNQAELLAAVLAERWRLECLPDALERIRETQPQVGLKEKARLANVRGAFAVPEKQRSALVGKDVILVDDVFTTGATLRECGRTLKRIGVRWVYAVTFAKR